MAGDDVITVSSHCSELSDVSDAGFWKWERCGDVQLVVTTKTETKVETEPMKIDVVKLEAVKLEAIKLEAAPWRQPLGGGPLEAVKLDADTKAEEVKSEEPELVEAVMTDPYLQFMNLLDTYDAGLDELPGPTGEVLSDDELRRLFQQLNPKYTERLHDPSYYEHVTKLINMKKQEEEAKKGKRNQAKGQGKQGKKNTGAKNTGAKFLLCGFVTQRGECKNALSLLCAEGKCGDHCSQKGLSDGSCPRHSPDYVRFLEAIPEFLAARPRRRGGQKVRDFWARQKAAGGKGSASSSSA